jgi:hypothetical protein
VASLTAWHDRRKPSTGCGSGRGSCCLLSDGMATRAIGRAVGCTTGTASKWRVRYARQRLAGLDETGERGAEAKYTQATNKRILKVLDGSPPDGYGRWKVIGVEAGTLQPASPVVGLTPRRLLEAIEIARTLHPSVGVAVFGIDAALLQVKINEGTLYPQVAPHRHGIAELGNQPDHRAAAVRRLRAGPGDGPIYQGGAEYSQIRQAKETVGQKRIDLDTARGSVQAGVVASWGQLEASKAQILATTAQVAAAEIALSGVREAPRRPSHRTALVTAQHDRVVASYTCWRRSASSTRPSSGSRSRSTTRWCTTSRSVMRGSRCARPTDAEWLRPCKSDPSRFNFRATWSVRVVLAPTPLQDESTGDRGGVRSGMWLDFARRNLRVADGVGQAARSIG